MAGDWIKMRSSLFTHPKVVRISSALKADTLRTVGALMSVWCLFDAHSVDGKLDGYTTETLDDHLRWPRFAAAMVGVKWLEADGESLVLPEFETHNGQSAKRRAQDADRKKTIRKTSASQADKMRTREEKRREDIEASARTAGEGEKSGEVIDRNTGEIFTPPSVLGQLTPDQSNVVVTVCKAMRKMGCQRFSPGDELLAALSIERFTAEQIVRCAGEKALRDASLWDDPDVDPELFELFINGASQGDMHLTPKQHGDLRAAVSRINAGYIAAALRGKRHDATIITGKTYGTATSKANRGDGPRGNSAVERVKAANAAAEQRELAELNHGQ